MQKHERLALIAAKTWGLLASPYKAKGLSASVNPTQKRVRKRSPIPEYPNAKPFMYDGGDEWNLRDRLKQWFKEPDKVPVKMLRHKRQKRISPLTKIAQQLPRKLPKLTFDPKTRRRL